MLIRNAAYLVVLAYSLAYAPSVAAKRAHAAPVEDVGDARPGEDSPDTVTWWCVDLNDVYHVDVPVVAGRGFLVAPTPSPLPTTCSETAYPVVVPLGSQFTVAGSEWLTNKTYSGAVRDALTEMGYPFLDASPMEDLMKKIVEVRIEVRTFPANAFVASFSFEPRQTFRRFELRRLLGPLVTLDETLIAAGITSVEEAGRLPTVAFPALVGPLAPGQYRARVFWTLSDLHNDGVGVGPDNFLPPGPNLRAAPRFVVSP